MCILVYVCLDMRRNVRYTFMHVCMYACMNVCMYACMHVCVCVCVHACVCVSVCMSQCMYVFMDILHDSMRVCMYYMCFCTIFLNMSIRTWLQSKVYVAVIYVT
jgi:hypothetical protein